MLIDFNTVREVKVTGMNGGTGQIAARMYAGAGGKIIPCTLEKGSSIGMHAHPTSDDINYVLAGTGKAVCDGKEELLTAGTCHICKKGSSHSILNTGETDPVLLTVVVER